MTTACDRPAFPIRVRRTGMWNGREERRLISCTVGQLIFNHAIPQDLGFVDRSNPEKIFDLEIQEVVTKSILDKIIYRCIKEKGSTVTAEMLDMIKAQGFKFSTRGSITVSCSDMTVPPKKYELIEEAGEKDYQNHQQLPPRLDFGRRAVSAGDQHLG